ncbi:MAG: lipopolysaccharide kinase InaA family protein [Nitrospiria bacterium]
MWLAVDERFSESLGRQGLRAFGDFMACRGNRVVKRLASKSIVTVELDHGAGRVTYYLKRHWGALRAGEALRAWLSGFSVSWGRKEWEVIQAFRACGIPTLTPAAAGECGRWLRRESFLLTEELSGFQSVETRWRTTPPGPAEKRAMIVQIADLTRRMHAQGFNHRDFYLCHLFVRLDPIEGWQWRVLDLQRVDRRRWFRSRWLIKDLAALNYSAPAFVTLRDRCRFLRLYLGPGAGRTRLRGLARAVARKTERIRRHDRHRAARGPAPAIDDRPRA